MQKLTKYFFIAFAFALLAPLNGCSDPAPASVTEGMEQSAIEAFKEQERKISEEGMADMEE